MVVAPGCVSSADADFCEAARSAQTSMSDRPVDPFEAVTSGDHNAAAAALEELSTRLAALADAAPDEIKADADALSDAIDATSEVLADHDYDLAAIGQDPEALATITALSSTDIERSAETVSGYATDHCDGVTLSL